METGCSEGSIPVKTDLCCFVDRLGGCGINACHIDTAASLVSCSNRIPDPARPLQYWQEHLCLGMGLHGMQECLSRAEHPP